jgi:DNA-directed RNA polymerase subunit F
MIKQMKPLTLSEVVNLAGDSETEKELKSFIKKYVKLDEKEAKKMREELQKLDLIKLKEENIIKIIDFMPKDASDLMKVLPEASLDQEEINKILEIVSKY